MENQPILKVYTNRSTVNTIRYYPNYIIVDDIEDSDVVFVGNESIPSPFLFPNKFSVGYHFSKENDLEDLKLIFKALSAKKPIVGFMNAFLLIAILSGDMDIYFCSDILNFRTIELGKNKFNVNSSRHFIPVPRRGSSNNQMIGRAIDGRPSSYLKSSEHDPFDIIHFERGEAEILRNVRLNALTFNFTPTRGEVSTIIDELVRSFVNKTLNPNDFICNDLTALPQPTPISPVDFPPVPEPSSIEQMVRDTAELLRRRNQARSEGFMGFNGF